MPSYTHTIPISPGNLPLFPEPSFKTSSQCFGVYRGRQYQPRQCKNHFIHSFSVKDGEHKFENTVDSLCQNILIYLLETKTLSPQHPAT
ncbi:hypothetical protein RRG08_059366 [Elysia crispata]|uniref:Uncharacterized protein n=1 Tax=Elysia crispata TaxID=231223 RepID=A0AAE1BG89_9GAST|nr:hypothetical protein RRG08_059366 [Elysia crispata]